MALLFFTGFEYGKAQGPEWAADYNAGVITSPKRNGSYAMDVGGGTAYTAGMGNKQTLIAGGAFYSSTGPPGANYYILTFQDGNASSVQLYLRANNDWSVSVVRGDGTVLGTSVAGVLPGTGIWYYVEFKAKIDNATGTYEVRINGVSKLSGSGADTQNSANAYATQIGFGSSSGLRCDDVYVCDDSGAANNDFLGDCKVEGLLPSGAGTYAEWTPSAGSNYQNVDDVGPHDGDSTYNSSSTANQRDLFAMGNLATSSGTVKGVKFVAVVRKDDAGSRSVALMSKSGTTETLETTQSCNDSYTIITALRETDPNTSAAWTISNVNALEAGIKLIS